MKNVKLVKIIVEFDGGEPEQFNDMYAAWNHIKTLKEAYSAYLNDFTVTLCGEIPATFHNPSEEVEQEFSGHEFKNLLD